MSLPADFPPIVAHLFETDAGESQRLDTCRVCGFPESFGGLHPDEPVAEPVPDTTGWQHGDVLHAAGGVFKVRAEHGHGLRFVPLDAIADGQATVPHGARLLVRNGEPV